MPLEELIELMPARIRRRYKRGLTAKPQQLLKKLRRAVFFIIIIRKKKLKNQKLQKLLKPI